MRGILFRVLGALALGALAAGTDSAVLAQGSPGWTQWGRGGQLVEKWNFASDWKPAAGRQRAS